MSACALFERFLEEKYPENWKDFTSGEYYTVTFKSAEGKTLMPSTTVTHSIARYYAGEAEAPFMVPNSCRPKWATDDELPHLLLALRESGKDRSGDSSRYYEVVCAFVEYRLGSVEA